MSTTRRRVRLATAVLASTVIATPALAACSGSSGEAGADDKNVTLRMTVWTNDKAQVALFNSIAASYKTDHPEIKSIKFDYVPIEGYTTALTTQVAGSNPPDLAWVLERDAPDFVSSGALRDVSKTLQGTPKYQYSDLTPAATKLWRQDGKLYAYPFSTSPFGVFFNKDLLKKAGVSKTPEQLAASGEWTWTNAEKIAKQVAAHTDKQGLVIRDWDYKTSIQLAAIWRAFGAEAWSSDGKSCGFTSPQMTKAMTFLHKAIFKDKALPGPGVTADFFAGESGMTVTQISRASLLKGNSFKWGIVPLPSGPAGSKQVIGQAGVSVLSKSKHPKQATDFLAYFTNPANSAKLAKYFPPARTKQLTTATLAKAAPDFTPAQLKNVVLNGIKTGKVLPSHKNSAKLATQLQTGLDPLWKADADVPKVLAGVCKAIDPVLSQ